MITSAVLLMSGSLWSSYHTTFSYHISVYHPQPELVFDVRTPHLQMSPVTAVYGGGSAVWSVLQHTPTHTHTHTCTHTRRLECFSKLHDASVLQLYSPTSHPLRREERVQVQAVQALP